MGNRFFCIAIMILALVYSLRGGSKLAVVRASAGVLEVQLANSEEVGGIQFSLQVSSDLVLGPLVRGGRIQDSQWVVSSCKLSDTVVNVIILSSTCGTLCVGGGALVRIVYTESKPSAQSTASLANVMIADAHADSLAVELEGLSWSEHPFLAGNDDGSKEFVFGQNYPNPFNPSTVISYQLNKGALVRLSIYDIAGREIARLIDQFQSAGQYRVEWNSDSKNGVRAASGLYFARLNVDNASQTRRMMLVK